MDSRCDEVSFDEAQLDVRLVVPECKRAEIGVLISLDIKHELEKSTARIDPTEIKLYTRESEGFIKINERIKELAKQIAGLRSDRQEIVSAIWDFMFDDLILGVIHYDKIDPQIR